jgi:hypothetical protein
MAMADGNCNCDSKGDRDGNSNGQWQGRWQWPKATTMVMANDDGNGNNNGDGNGNRNGNGNGNGNGDTMAMATATMTVTTNDTREGCLFMCWQCAVLWQGEYLASPPWSQRSKHCPALHHGGATAKSVCSISRGRVPDSSPWIYFFLIFFNYLFSLLNNLLFSYTNSFPQEPHQPIDGLPRFLLYFLSR